MLALGPTTEFSNRLLVRRSKASKAGIVSLEAENYTRVEGDGTPATARSSHSGAGYMLMTEVKKLQYDIQFKRAGLWAVFMRSWSDRHESNGCHLSLDGDRITKHSKVKLTILGKVNIGKVHVSLPVIFR